MAVIRCDAQGMDVGIRLFVEAFRKDRDHEDVDEEADKEGDGSFNEEVHVGLLHLVLLGSVNVSWFDQCTEEGRIKSRLLKASTQPVQVEVVWHNDGTNNSNSLKEFFLATTTALWQEKASDHLTLIRRGNHNWQLESVWVWQNNVFRFYLKLA